MIHELTVSNFRSLGENIRIRFGDLTALVGQNGSGKSNLVDALLFVKDSMEMGLAGAITQRHGIAAIRRWSGGHPFNVEFRLEIGLPAGQGVYAFSLTGDRQEEYRIRHEEAKVTGPDAQHHASFLVKGGEWIEGPHGLQPNVDEATLTLPAIGGDERFKPLYQALRRMAIYAIYPDTLAQPQRYNQTKPMQRHGDNWVSILRDQPKDTWKPELVAALERLSGDIDDVRVTPAASYLVAQFHHRTAKRKKKWFDAVQESDGTLRFAGILTALLQEPPLPVIGIEEPELTVHPGALPLLFDYLKQASARSQLLVTTHSPELLDLMNADDVWVVQRADGVTTVAPMDERQRNTVREGLMSLGELMITEGLRQQTRLPLEGGA